ncbi:FAD-binding oxidoreductase [Spirosoma sp.]|uniref:FAD-binding oxidoreductase n=1 Tax=Spirosoma sp. TaxID=1899569 RepID=UPI003B3A423F
MKRLFLIAFFLVQLASLTLGQGIRAVGDAEAKTSPKNVPAITPETYTGRIVSVAKGGGFTGFATTYYLLNDGKLFRRRSPDSSFTFIKQQSTAQTKRLFNTIEVTCKIKKTQFDHPGNRYTVVRWREGKQSYKVAWGMPGHTVPTTYPKFVNSFMALVPASAK